MFSIFRTRWDRVELADVRAFLADAEDEGVTWEAKGTERPRPESVRKAVCGFANAQGGYLIIGAEREEGEPWQAAGVDFRGDEPVVWLDQTIRDGLRPVPPLDVRFWPVNERTVAVVQVKPVGVPPCMTTSGEVFERVSGRTVKVEDPTILARLYERGQAAEANAEATGLRACGQIFRGSPMEGSLLYFALALAPTGKTEDVAGRLFAPSFREALVEVVEGLPMEPLYDYRAARGGITIQTQQDALWGHTDFLNRQVWRVRAAWDSSVAVHLALTVNEEDDPGAVSDSHLFGDAVRPAADAASTLLSKLQGYGRTHVVFGVTVRRFRLLAQGHRERRMIPGPTDLGPIRRWTDNPEALTDDLLESIKRELLRACGFYAAEPEPQEVANESV